jgi:DNA-directed RNA polymerase specialized sigma24 family protein
MDREKRHLIEDADWDRLPLELAKYARWLIRRKRWRTGSGNILAEGKCCEDLVQEAVKRALDETRKWDPTRVDLLMFLKGTVRSVVSHLADCDDNKLTVLGLDDEGQLGRERDEEVPFGPKPVPTPEELVLAAEDETRVYRMVLDAVQGKPELEDIALCLMDGVHKARDIAENTGIEINRVYQLKRQFKTILDSLAKKAESCL